MEVTIFSWAGGAKKAQLARATCGGWHGHLMVITPYYFAIQVIFIKEDRLSITPTVLEI